MADTITEIIPAILPESFDVLEEQLLLVKGLARAVHVDVSDGRFTPALTFPYTEGSQQIFADILAEKIGLPHWQDFDFELHLMIKNPESAVSDWIRAGAERIVVHVEAATDFAKIQKKCSGAVELGLALRLETPLEKIEAYVKDIQFVQLMSIAGIGSQGQEFDEGVFERIRELRRMSPKLTISIDGGVSLDNAPALIEAGANRLVVGSAIFESDSIRETIEQFKSL
jgi:ribulose-phosphate 3-epimerase